MPCVCSSAICASSHAISCGEDGSTGDLELSGAFHTLEGANSDPERGASVVAVVLGSLDSWLPPQALIAKLNIKQAATDANRQLLNDDTYGG